MPQDAEGVAGPRFGRRVELEPILKQIERVNGEAGDDTSAEPSDRLNKGCGKPAHTGTGRFGGALEGRKGAGHGSGGDGKRSGVCRKCKEARWPVPHRISIGHVCQLLTEERRLYRGHIMLAGGESCVGVTRDVRAGAMTSSRGARSFSDSRGGGDIAARVDKVSGIASWTVTFSLQALSFGISL
jgi:hypothetical protein